VNEGIQDAIDLYNCITEAKISKLLERESKYYLHLKCLIEVSIFRKI
jgi:hypothetical protein